jgi:hypothetical protein
MYTFCFVVGSSAEQALRACTGALSRVASCLPDLGSPARIESSSLPEARAAFATLKPQSDVSPSLIQSLLTPELALLVFGEHVGVADLPGAIAREFLARGINGVAKLPGNFSAVVVERARARVWLCGTLLGHRSLFYYAGQGLLVASPHDLTLLGTGHVPFELDHVSLASMVACDWSLMGRSLLRGVTRCHPLQAIAWENGVLTEQPVAALELGDRIDPRDGPRMHRQMETIAERLMLDVRARVSGQESVRCSLTAGMDSRAVFAAIRGAAPDRVILASTTGQAGSPDVVVAERLAALVGARHERQEPVRPIADDFVGSTRLRAFFCSGDTNAKRAMTRLPRMDPAAPPHAGGTGGEIYRGFFYPYFGVTGTAPRGSERIAQRLLDYRFRRLAKLPFSDASFASGVRARLGDALNLLQSCSGNPYDLVDLLYLFERYGRWGAAQASLPWRVSWSPFESVSAIVAAFQLPAPIGKYCSVHSLLIRKYLPERAYWMPINGGQFLALDGAGRSRYALRQALNALSAIRQVVRRKIRKGARAGDEVKAGFLTGDLGQLSEGLIDHEGSLSRVVFGRDGVRALLTSQRQKQDQLAVIGVLLTAEMWLGMAREIRAASVGAA